MKKLFGGLLATFFVGSLVVAGSSQKAEALPAFAKKHEATCTLCHNVWPQLNQFGESFKINGYQMPGSEDGADVGKRNNGNYFGDSGDANLPITLRLRQDVALTRSTKTETSGAKDSRRSFLGVERDHLILFSGGTVNKNVSYFLESTGLGFPQGDQAFIALNNLGGPGLANLEIGVSNPNQFGVVTTHRTALLAPIMVNGGSSLMSAGATTVNSGSMVSAATVGLQLYGKPIPMFTYALSLTDGGSTLDGIGDKSNWIGLTLRGDFGPFAASWNFNTGSRFTGSGSTNANEDDAAIRENKISNHLVSAKYDANPVVARIWFGMGTNNSDLANNGTSNTTTDSSTSGFGFDVWYYNEMFEVGAGFDKGTVKVDSDLNKALQSGVYTDKNGNIKEELSRTSFALQANYLLSANARLGLLYQGGGLDGDFLESASGATEYTNSKALLKIDLAI